MTHHTKLDPFTGEPLCHPRTGEPIIPIGHRRNGGPIWPQLGAEDPPAPPADDADPDGGDDGDQDPPGAEDLADAGKKALDAMKAERATAKREARAEKRRADAAEAELARLKGGTPPAPPGDQPDPEQIRQEAERNATAKANGRVLRAEIRAAAAGRLHDPADALAHLNLDDFDVDDDGGVDTTAITEALEELLERKPYLAKKTAEPGPPKPPSFDSGPRGGSTGGTAHTKATGLLARHGIALPATTPADTTKR
jgi:hypothetical protein